MENDNANSPDFVRAKIDGVPWEMRGSSARYSTLVGRHRPAGRWSGRRVRVTRLCSG
jgi:hypothetical protein